jgi:hypothetical protein
MERVYYSRRTNGMVRNFNLPCLNCSPMQKNELVSAKKVFSTDDPIDLFALPLSTQAF